MQTFNVDDSQQRVPLLGAVGPLQFDVVQFRLQDEYGVASKLERAPWTVLRWVHEGTIDPAKLVTGAQLATDGAGRRVVLFPDEWTCRYFTDRAPDVKLGVAAARRGGGGPVALTPARRRARWRSFRPRTPSGTIAACTDDRRPRSTGRWGAR